MYALVKKWVKERDKVVKTYDVNQFKNFFRKWQNKGIYDKSMPLPADETIELAMRKMVCHMANATDTEKKKQNNGCISMGVVRISCKDYKEVSEWIYAIPVIYQCRTVMT